MRVKSGLAEMLKGGVIMDVVNAEQAKIAEDSGAVAVMALERVPADIRRDGGVARMSDPAMVQEIQEAVTIPVMAKCRIGHFVEAQILQALEIDYIDESEVLTPADIAHHVDKWQFEIPFVCGATNLGEALRRIAEGAAMIRTKGEAGTGDVVNAVTHMRAVFGGIRRLGSLREEELYAEAKELRAPYELVRWVAENGRLPVVTFTAGGIATPADAALCMQLGADGVFVGSGIFKSGDPALRAKAIVEATTHYRDRRDPGPGLCRARRADGSEHLETALPAASLTGRSRPAEPASAALARLRARASPGLCSRTPLLRASARRAPWDGPATTDNGPSQSTGRGHLMHFIRGLRHRRLALAAIAIFAVAGGVAYAAIPDAGTGVYHACMLKNVGTIRIIDPERQRCSASLEVEITFNKQGPTGNPGPTGPPGPPGPPGEDGRGRTARTARRSRARSRARTASTR